MSNFKKPRITRGAPPEKPIKRYKHRKALPELLRDFGPRCAYSMQHESRSGALEVEHFDPSQKKDLIQKYSNLFLASRHCNGKKGDRWPNHQELKAGCRFLNPCEEMDYGEQIFEDPETNRLVGMNPAAIWHIRICGLNSSNLIEERKRRARHLQKLERQAFILTKGASPTTLQELVASFRDEVDLMIPPIPPPPNVV
jgi:hypothetical protein